VPLSFIRQAGAEGIVSSLHHIPYGEVWTVEEIEKHKKLIADAGMVWNVVESLPVHEDIKVGGGKCEEYIENYKISLRNLGKCGVKVITYNFMPVLDWVRTDLRYKLPDGSEALYFNQAQFAAFEIFILKRKGAETDYPAEKVKEAEEFFKSLSPEQVQEFTVSIIDNFPGFKGVTLDDVRSMLQRYETLSREKLEQNLTHFLSEVCPVAEEAGCIMTIHPDDPPYPILGLPRIFGNQEDITRLLTSVPSKANGICFCAGSFSGSLKNDIVSMFKSCADRVGFIHLRSTQHDGKGNFFEANHLEGCVNMPELVTEIIKEQIRRKEAGREDWRIPFRPDHGHTMLDDLAKPLSANPGYSAIGRLKGLAELRGLERGILYSAFPELKF
jgi:mannonate dehydratase